jgi:hypothetical protein
MKKLSIGLLAAALSLPFAFAAAQPTSSTPAQTAKTAKKTKTAKTKHHKAKAMKTKTAAPASK